MVKSSSSELLPITCLWIGSSLIMLLNESNRNSGPNFPHSITTNKQLLKTNFHLFCRIHTWMVIYFTFAFHLAPLFTGTNRWKYWWRFVISNMKTVKVPLYTYFKALRCFNFSYQNKPVLQRISMNGRKSSSSDLAHHENH